MKKTCQNCNIEFHANHNRTVYCSLECKAEIRFKKKQEKIISNGIEGIDYVIDQWNGYATPRIYGQWMSSMHPGKTTDDYLKDFPDAPLCCEKDHIATSKNSGKHMKKPKYRKMASDQIKGANNPNHKSKTTKAERRSRSPFSEDFINYESPEDARQFQLEHCNKGKYNTRLSYWIEEGYSPEEAIKMLKERQATFTLNKCIAKYGKERGHRVFEERQRRWKASLQQNFIEHGDGRSPSSQFANSIIQAICSRLQIQVPTKEKYIRDGSTGMAYSYDFTLKHKRKIIEFNGDYWHCNPAIYEAEYFNKSKKKTAQEIWDYDQVKIELAERKGYQVLTIWESEWNDDPNRTVERCIKFISG